MARNDAIAGGGTGAHTIGGGDTITGGAAGAVTTGGGNTGGGTTGAGSTGVCRTASATSAASPLCAGVWRSSPARTTSSTAASGRP